MNFRAIFILPLLVLSAVAQNPAASSGDPGPSQTFSNGVTAPVGYILNPLFNTVSSVVFPASIVKGSGGDLYFTETVGPGCSSLSATHIFRVAMNGNTPVQPLSITQFTTSTVVGHVLAYDDSTDSLYAAGTCSQTAFVYRIPNTGVPQVLNASAPINDPDGLAVGTLPGSPNRQLFVATQDGLEVIDLTTLVLSSIAVDLTQVSATALGNWSSLVWDSRTSTLIATNIGRPVTRNTVEISFTSATTAVATSIGPDNHFPLLVDQQGVRWFGFNSEIGFMNPALGGNLFSPVIGAVVPGSQLVQGEDGDLVLMQPSLGQVDHLHRPLTSDTLTIRTGVVGDVFMKIRAPAPRGSEGYLLFTGVSGATPGTAYGPVIVPLNADIITQVAVVLAVANDPVTLNWAGMLPANGQANPVFHFPPGVIPAGVTFQLAFALGNPEFASNAIWVHVVP
jgi:hypothetical protein